MSDFWLGVLCAVIFHFVSGAIAGILTVVTMPVYFFSAGWKYKRMMTVVGINAMEGPIAVINWWLTFQEVRRDFARSANVEQEPPPPKPRNRAELIE